MANIISALNWRYATKKYDSTRKLSQEKLDIILDSIRLSPSSFGLQPYTIISVVNPELREKLKAAAYGQSQVTDASHFLVFTAPTNLNSKHVDQFVKQISTARQLPVDQGYFDNLNRTISGRTPENNINWSTHQAYLALGVALTAAAVEGVDSSPMEGFNSTQFDEILGLKEKNLTTVVLLALGTRSSDDKYAQLIKVRKPKEEMFITM